MKKLIFKLIYPYIMKQLQKLFAGNNLLHGLWMAILGAVSGALYPIILAWIGSNPIPDVKTIAISTGKVALGAAVLYLSKNQIWGGSGQPIMPITKSVMK